MWRTPATLAARLLLACAIMALWLARPLEAQSASLVVSPSSLNVSEGGSATFTVSLSDTPSGDVTVSIASSDSSALKPAFSTALFTPAHTGPYTIPVLGLTDSDTTSETATLTLTPSGGGVSATASVSVSVTDAGGETKTLNAPTLSLRNSNPTLAPSTIEGDLNWTARAVKQCSIDRYELHYKKSTVSSWPSVSDTADADSGVHIIHLESRHHGADVLWALVVLGQGSQPTLDAVQYDVRARVDGADCTQPSGFSAVDQESPAPAFTQNQAQALAVPPPPAESENSAPGSSAQPQQSASLVVSPSSLNVSEGGSATFTVSLSGTPSGDVTVSIASSDSSALKPAFSAALFTPAHTGPYTIPVLGLTDSDTTSETATLTLTPSGGGVSATATVSVAVTDTTPPKTLNSPTLSLGTPDSTWAVGTLKGDLNWTARAVKQCSIDRYELHYKKSTVSSWPSVSDTADADSGVHIIRLDSQDHGANDLQAAVVLGQGKLDVVQYDARARVDGADCTKPSGFSAVAQGSPRQAQTPTEPPTDNGNTGGGGGGGGSPPPSEPEPPPLQGSLENPGPGSAQSGIGLLSGWVCEADQVTLVLNPGTPAAQTLEAAYGTDRGDTTPVCGDRNNGFGLLFNWNLLGDGTHTIVAQADGEEFGRTTVTVTTLGEEFVREAAGECAVADFPETGDTTRLVWQAAQQNFVIAAGSRPTGTGQAGTAGVGRLENPGVNSYQSGIGLISGWVCNATQVSIRLNGQSFPAAYGTERGDTAATCGDRNNGFGLLFNWNLLGAGEHEVEALADGVVFGRTRVRVTTLGAEFVRGAAGSCTVAGFPSPGEAVTVAWQESRQNFVLTDVR